MRRTEQVQGLRLMKFEEVYGRTHRGGLSQAEAAEVLGVSERTFRRWRDRYEAEGADGLYDRRLGRLSARRAPVDEVARVLEFVRHPLLGLHGQALPREAGGRSRLQAQLQLAAAELASPWAQARGAQAWGAPAQAAAPCPARHDVAPGRLEPRVGPRSMVGPDRHHGRCDQRYLLGLLRRRRGHHVELPGGVRGDLGQGPVLLALRRPRQPLLEHARGRRQGGQGHPDPGRPRPGAARHRVDPGLLARGKGALGAHVRHLAEAPAPGTQLAGITDMVEANRFLKEVFLPQHNARFATPAEDRGTAFVPFTGALDDILCIHEERTVSNDNTVRYKRLALQIPAGRHRRHYVKARVRVHEYPDGTMAVFHGPRCLARYHADGQPIDSQTREAA